MHRLAQDLPHKHLGSMKFEAPIHDGNLYRRVEDYLRHPSHQTAAPDIVFIQGIEHSFYDYEDEKKSHNGWNSKDIYSYSWKGVPRVLTNLNQQRERFRDNFNTCLVFLIPLFVLKYMIRRAPDFFDWRSGVFNFPTQAEEVERGVRNVLAWPSQSYGELTPNECMARLLEIQNLIEENHLVPERKVDLHTKAGLLHTALGQYETAIDRFEQALTIRSSSAEALWGRGEALSQIERHQEALISYTQALETDAGYAEAFYGRGNVLSAMGKYQDAIADYTQALVLRPNYQEALLKMVGLQSSLRPAVTLKAEVSDRLFRRLRTATTESEEVCRAIAGRIAQEVLDYPRLTESGSQQNPEPTPLSLQVDDSLDARIKHGRQRVNHCLRYYRMGSRRGRVELHSVLASLAFPHLVRTGLDTLDKHELEDVEDFLQTFYIETLDIFRHQHQLPDNYQPQTLLELSEYMAFTEEYGQRPGLTSPEQSLIALRAHQFTVDHLQP